VEVLIPNSRRFTNCWCV